MGLQETALLLGITETEICVSVGECVSVWLVSVLVPVLVSGYALC